MAHFIRIVPFKPTMDKRQLRKILKPMLASFAYTRHSQEFYRFFEEETDLEEMTNAQRRRLIDVLKEFAGGDLMEPNYA